jgi:predicted secreted hydrolase
MTAARTLIAALLAARLAMAALAEDWKAAVEPHPFRFPQDHAAHEDHRIEWWYYTGNLQSSEGRRFGYQLTFFRTGVTREPENPSRWTVRDLYMAHFAISDIESKAFHFFERVSRRGIGWAGAATDRYHVWNGDWEVRLEGDRHRLVAQQEGCRIELTLAPGKPPVLHGEQGLSRKGPSEGNASHYYSYTRMETTGALSLEGRRYAVSGASWMDHEFSTSFLEAGQQGWDWFAIQFDDGRELMLYQIRRSDGTADPHSSGTLVARDGSSVHLRSDEFSLVPGRRWQSERSGAAYPVEWTIHVPGKDLKLAVRAAFPGQEMNTTGSTGIAYWEGAVVIEGRSDGRPVGGRGYLEMTGYAGKSLGRMLE